MSLCEGQIVIEFFVTLLSLFGTWIFLVRGLLSEFHVFGSFLAELYVSWAGCLVELATAVLAFDHRLFLCLFYEFFFFDFFLCSFVILVRIGYSHYFAEIKRIDFPLGDRFGCGDWSGFIFGYVGLGSFGLCFYLFEIRPGEIGPLLV